MKYKILWDNGANCCDEFPDRFDTMEQAEMMGEEWLWTMKDQDPEWDGDSYEIVEA